MEPFADRNTVLLDTLARGPESCGGLRGGISGLKRFVANLESGRRGCPTWDEPPDGEIMFAK